MKEEVEVWLARDKNGELYVYIEEIPYKSLINESWDNYEELAEMPKEYFPNIKWEDEEPTKAKITLIK